MENGEQRDHLNWVIVVVPGEEERGVGWEVFKKKKKLWTSAVFGGRTQKTY